MNNIEILKAASKIRKEEYHGTISQKEAYQIAKERLVNNNFDFNQEPKKEKVNKEQFIDNNKNFIIKPGKYINLSDYNILIQKNRFYYSGAGYRFEVLQDKNIYHLFDKGKYIASYKSIEDANNAANELRKNN